MKKDSFNTLASLKTMLLRNSDRKDTDRVGVKSQGPAQRIAKTKKDEDKYKDKKTKIKIQ